MMDNKEVRNKIKDDLIIHHQAMNDEIEQVKLKYAHLYFNSRYQETSENSECLLNYLMNQVSVDRKCATDYLSTVKLEKINVDHKEQIEMICDSYERTIATMRKIIDEKDKVLNPQVELILKYRKLLIQNNIIKGDEKK